MFGGGTSTEYDDIVVKTTDENLTSENWELILNLCDKVQDEGQTGAHGAIAAVLKRLAHRNPNVQLYALSLAEALSKNLGIEVHREIASRAFTQALEKLITDRNTHDKVRKRALGLVLIWTGDFEKDESLGIMEDCYNNLKARNYKFEQASDPPPPAVDDEIRRKEEEELQRVLEMSMEEQSRPSPAWTKYSLTSSSGAGGSGSSGSGAGKGSSAAASSTPGAPAAGSSSTHPFAQPKYQAGYAPARTPSPVAQPLPSPKKTQKSQPQPQTKSQQPQPQAQQHYNQQYSASLASTSTPSLATTSTRSPSPTPVAAAAVMPANNIVTRVRALHTFEPTEPGELSFEKGDIIKVVDRGYKDWWRGQLKGRTGIFPVNYVEAMPEPTASELAKEAEQEAAVFAQAVNVEKLLNMLRALDPAKDNLADDEEIQELYRSSMALRPKIVKLIDKYSQKRADLVSMNETFVRARTIFDRMMEESLARHTGVYDQPTYRPPYAQARPDSRAGPRRPEYGPSSSAQAQAFGWNPNVYEQPGYNAYPTPAGAYPGQVPVQQQQPPIQGQHPGSLPGQPQVYADPNVAPGYGAQGQPTPQQQPQQQPQQGPGYSISPQPGYPQQPYSQQGPVPYPAQQPQQQQPQQQQQVQQVQQQQPIQPTQQQQLAQAQPVQQQQQQQAIPPIQQQQPAQTQPFQQLQQAIQPQQVQPLHAQNGQSFQQEVQQEVQYQQQMQPVQQPQPIRQSPIQQTLVQQTPVQQTPVQQTPVQQIPIQQTAIQQTQQPVQQAQPIQRTESQQQPVQQQPHEQQQQQPVHVQPEAAQAQPQTQAAVVGPAVSVSPQPQPQQPISGPAPYVYDPRATYADPNVQAWAQYYAQGGRELAGAVYFLSIPGVTDGSVPGSPRQPTVGQQGQQGQQQQQRQLQQVQQQQEGFSSLGRAQSHQARVQQQQQQGNTDGFSSTARRQSYESSAQSPQRQTQPLGESELGYAGEGGSISPTQKLAFQYKGVQLSDGPQYASQVQPSYQAGGSQPDLLTNQAGSTSVGASFGASDSARNRSDSYGSTQVTSSTPSWVLPKKGGPGTSPGGSPGSYFPMNNQLGRHNLNDGGANGPGSSHPGLGTLA